MRALCDFAVLLTHSPSAVTPGEIERLREHGWTDAGIHDGIQVVSFFNYINRVADGVGIEGELEWERGGG